MCDDEKCKNSSTDDMYDYSVWYKGWQIGYMKSDKSCIDPFYKEIYDNLKSSKEEVKKEKFEEVAPAAESIPIPIPTPTPTPTSSLLDDVESTLRSVNDYCGVEVLSDCRFGEILMGEKEE